MAGTLPMQALALQSRAWEWRGFELSDRSLPLPALFMAAPDDDDDNDADDDIDDAADDPGAADPGADPDPGADDPGADVDAGTGDDAGAGGDDDAGAGDDDGAGADSDDGDDNDSDRANNDSDDDAVADTAGRNAQVPADTAGSRRGRAGTRSADDDPGQDDARWPVAELLGSDEIFDDQGYLARRSEVLALMDSGRSLDEVSRLGFSIEEDMPLPGAGLRVVRLGLPTDQTPRQALVRLRAANPGITFDYEHLYDFSPTGIGDFEKSAVRRADGRLTLSRRRDLRIGLIDSSVASAGSELSGFRHEQQVFISDSGEPVHEHGTAVASILASRVDGLLPEAQYFVASVFRKSARGDSVSSAADLARAIDWLMLKNTPVINMSLAGPPNAVLEAAVRRAQARGHLIVAAVGNAGPAARPQYPAAYPGVVGVTAIDSQGRVYRRAGRGGHVRFAAPGVEVGAVVVGGGAASVSGTSFAAPYVTAALALQHNRVDPTSAQAAVDRVANRAVDRGSAGRDPIYGFGIVPLLPGDGL